MGGGGGGSSGLDLSKLTQAAEDRLKQLAETGTRLMFACEGVDRKALDSHLARSKVFNRSKISIFDSKQRAAALDEIEKVNVVIVFTADATSSPFLDQIVEASLGKKRQGIHAKATEDSLIPTKATAYRWPSLTWDRLEKMFAA